MTSPDPAALDFGDFLSRANRRLRMAPPSLADALLRRRGDDDLNDALMAMPLERDVRHAAVLVPVVDRSGAATLLLTQRASALRDHSGQIAFPGGKIDRADGTPLVAALREAEEEIGLERRFVQPLGYLDPYLSRTGFLIIPVVAALRPDFSLAINQQEVDDAFEVPLAFLMDVANHQRHSRTWQGTLRHYYAMPYGDRYIWGVTAGIIRNLYERLLVDGPHGRTRQGQPGAEVGTRQDPPAEGPGAAPDDARQGMPERPGSGPASGPDYLDDNVEDGVQNDVPRGRPGREP
jgi:8-oxo-dGTP pyrophosphatase MutT (NUDIX family)